MKNKEPKKENRCLPLTSIDLLDGGYSIGLFTFENDKITMQPGVYILQKPIIFGKHDNTKIEDVFCEPLGDVDSNLIANECYAAHKHSAEVCMLRRGVKKKT